MLRYIIKGILSYSYSHNNVPAVACVYSMYFVCDPAVLCVVFVNVQNGGLPLISVIYLAYMTMLLNQNVCMDTSA